jgi:hypothetical protein
MKVDKEGAMSASRSKLAMIPPALKTSGAVIAAEDPDAIHTVYARAMRGQSGFGLIGSAAAQANGVTATGFGAYGAAKAIYWTFFGPGKNVVLPSGTRVRLRMERPAESNNPPTQPFL